MKEKIQKEISYLKSVIESDKAHLDASVADFKENIQKYDAYQIATFAAGLANDIQKQMEKICANEEKVRMLEWLLKEDA